MTNQERDELIMEKLNSGMSLSDLQKLLDSEYGIKLTYFDLRMIVSELRIEWDKQEKKRKPAIAVTPTPQPQPAPTPAPAPKQEEAFGGEMANEEATEEEGDIAEDDAEDAADGETTVTVDDVPMRGAVMSGSVKFASGASGKWMMNRMGQLGLASLDEGSEQPTQDDLMLFQQELQTVLQEKQDSLEKQAFDGRTQVEISPLVKPGCDINGTVTFASGASGEWFVAGGKLDFSLDEGSSQPTHEDLSLFQIVLSAKLKEKGYA
ncbi:MAG: hypothetical protein J5833_06530 [Victivallales bacterium]|nr:hypothetical protein [Victivallales bacterium]